MTDLQSKLQEKLNKFVNITSIKYLENKNLYEVLYEDNGNERKTYIKDTFTWYFKCGPGELLTNTINKLRDTDKVKRTINLSNNNIKTLNSIIKENNIDISKYFSEDLQNIVSSCKAVRVDAEPANKENRYHAYLIWEVQIKDNDIEDAVLERIIKNNILNTIYYEYDKTFAEFPLRDGARRTSKKYKRREDGSGYEADVSDSIAYFVPYHLDKKNKDKCTTIYKI